VKKCIKSYLNISKTSLILLLILFLSSCGVTENDDDELAYVEKEALADGFGNHDGEADEEEIEIFTNHFNNNDEAWAIGAISSANWDSTVNKITSDEVVQLLRQAPLRGPFSNKDAFEEISIRIPWLGIYLIKVKNDKYFIAQYFKAPGPQVGQDEYWTELEIY
jgi:hypothetical protein